MRELRPQFIRYLVLHTVAVRGSATLEDIANYHINERGWEDVGYHYYIRKDGTIQEGRDDNYVGAHCRASNMNFKSLGICFEGHGDFEEWTQEQKKSFRPLCRKLQSKYNILDENVIGHREAYEQTPPPKSCPGKKVNMDKVRKIYPALLAEKINTARIEEFKTDINFDKVNINT